MALAALASNFVNAVTTPHRRIKLRQPVLAARGWIAAACQAATHAACEYYRLRELRKNCQRTPEELAADAAGDKHDSSLMWLKVNKLHTNRPSNRALRKPRC